MTDKVQKIRKEVERLQKRAEHNFDNSIAEIERQFWLGESNVLTLIGKYIDTMQEEPVSEDLEYASEKYACRFSSSKYGHDKVKDAFIAGDKWKEEQFEKSRVAHCDELTKEQAQIESDFVTQHLKEANRTPTFIDAIEYGMRLQKEQMMAKAIDGEVGYWNLRGLSINVKLPRSVREGDKVKVLVVKED